MVNYISIYGGSGYGMAYSWGDAVYAFSVFLALCIIIAGYILQSHREGFSVHEQPTILVMLGFIGLVYAVAFPVGFMILMMLVVISQHIGHHGQWIGIAIMNFAAWICFWRCAIPRTFRQNHA